MAGPRFRRRIPTLEEMEKADQIEASSRLGSFQKEEKSSDSAKVTPNGQSTISAQPPQSSPPKRMVSQKSLLSRQPLSRQTHSTKSKIFPKSGDPTSDKTEVRNRSNISGSVQDFERCPQVFQVTHGNITSQVNETSSVTPTVVSAAPASVGFKETHQINARISSATLEQYDGEVGHSGQPAMLEPNDHKLKQPCEEENNIRADVLPTLAKLGKTNSLVVNPRQRGNPILNFVRNVPWEFGNVVPDYVMGQSNCALYLSLRYHQLHPDYIHMRLKQLGHSFDLRVLLVQVDIKDPHHLLKDLAKICILADCTLMLAFSTEEAGRYLETYKVYENKAAEAIMERTDNNFNVQLSDCLTRVKPVNKTDCSTLLATFGSLQSIMASSAEDLSLCPGFGPQKAKSLHDVFHEPFLVSKKQRADTAI